MEGGKKRKKEQARVRDVIQCHTYGRFPSSMFFISLASILICPKMGFITFLVPKEGEGSGLHYILECNFMLYGLSK